MSVTDSRRMLRVLLIACVGLFAAFRVAASETPNTHTEYRWPPGTKLTAVDFGVTVEVDPGRTANVFWSNQFDFGDGSTAYTGMQSNGGEPRTFLFSAWKGDATRPGSPGSHCENFAENGVGKTCRMHREWKAGHPFLFRVASEGGGWFGVTITDAITRTSFKLGSIHTASTRISTENMSSWTEYFEWNFDTATCLNQPYSRARFSLPVSGDATAGVASTHDSSSSGKPGACRAKVALVPGGTIQANALGNSRRGPVAASDGLCLDAKDGGSVDGAVILYNCNGLDNQQWVLGANGALQLQSDLCIDAGGPGGAVTMQKCASRRSQAWEIVGQGLRSLAMGTCLTARAAEERVKAERCGSGPTQSWQIDRPS